MYYPIIGNNRDPGRVDIVEKFNAPLSSAYTKLRVDIPKKDLNEDEYLQLSVNYSITPSDQKVCFHVFDIGALLKPDRTFPTPTQLVSQG